MRLPADSDLNTSGDDYVKILKDNLQSLRATATACIASKEYQRAGSLTEAQQNLYQEGDFLLYDLRGPGKSFLPSKLTTPYKGPYTVMSQYKNDVTCKHANSGTVQIFHVDRVKPFYGSLEEATTLAQVDLQQFVIADITAYRDLFRSLPYKHFCRSVPQLRPLILKVAEATSQAKTIDRQPI
jgi:hypothetical protein